MVVFLQRCHQHCLCFCSALRAEPDAWFAATAARRLRPSCSADTHRARYARTNHKRCGAECGQPQVQPLEDHAVGLGPPAAMQRTQEPVAYRPSDRLSRQAARRWIANAPCMLAEQSRAATLIRPWPIRPGLGQHLYSIACHVDGHQPKADQSAETAHAGSGPSASGSGTASQTSSALRMRSTACSSRSRLKPRFISTIASRCGSSLIQRRHRSRSPRPLRGSPLSPGSV